MFSRFFIVHSLLISLFFASNSSWAHSSETNKATLILQENNRYQVTMSVDVIHLLKAHFESEKGDEAIIAQLQRLSLSKLKNLLSDVEQELIEGLTITVNPTASDNSFTTVKLKTLEGLNIKVLRDVLQNSYSEHQGKFLLSTQGQFPKNSRNISIEFPALLGNVQLGYLYEHNILIPENQASAVISLAPSNNSAQITPLIKDIAVFVEYIIQGYLHILPMGVDHILFVLALFLIATKLSTLLWQVSAFTLAHTITLALGIYGVVAIPANIVEPLIALSIAYVAIENIFRPNLSNWRLPLIFAFGLLHGLGFASVLLELGLAPEQYLLSLVAFNLGVEIGQLSVILLAFVCLGWFIKRHWYRNTVVKPVSAGIALTGLYWFIERLL